jgi:hypothetical protein
VGVTAPFPTKKIAALAGIFIGIGFAAGFLAGFSYRGVEPRQLEEFASAVNDGAEETPGLASAGEGLPGGGPEDEDSEYPLDAELILESHELGEDENGLFISGTIYNRSSHAYDAARVTFDLCDEQGKAYSGVTDITHDRMERGDSWGFTIYIPYSEMSLFSSYRLNSIMGTTK